MANHHRLFTSLTLLLAALTPSVNAQEAARTSRSLVSADPRAQYVVLKQTFARMINNGAIPAYVPKGKDPFDLTLDCASGGDYLGLSDKESETTSAVSTLSNLAFNVVMFRIGLSRAGYPESVFRPLLIQLEDEQLPLRLREIGRRYSGDPFPSERHYDAFKQKIIRELNSYRQRMAPTLPPIVNEGECGAGEVGITVRTEPTNGRVIFIPTFFYEVCKTQQIDPDDPAQCDRWREAPDGALFDVAGDYFYRAFWPDGVQRRGRLSFTNLKDGQTVTFRKQ
jgi:hypothetical protein